MYRNESYCMKVSNVTSFLPQVHVHRRGSDSLLKIIPAKILPKEYGGEAGPMLDHWGKDLNVLSLPSTQSLNLSTKLNLFCPALASLQSEPQIFKFIFIVIDVLVIMIIIK